MVLWCSGCASITSALRDVNIVSIEQETQLGERIAAEVVKDKQIVTDQGLNQKIKSMGERLVAGLPKRDYDYSFSVIQDNTPNAFTIPGGKIFVHTGLIQMASDESELAGVMGHEIGHAYHQHPAKALTRAYGLEYLTKTIFKDPTNKFQQIALQFAKGGFLARYGREDEYEADQTGLILAQKAGYAPSGLIRFLRKIQALEAQSRNPLAFLSSHPPTPDRIARLESMTLQIERSVPVAG